MSLRHWAALARSGAGRERRAGKPLSVGIKLETGAERFFQGIVSSFAKTGATKRYTHTTRPRCSPCSGRSSTRSTAAASTRRRRLRSTSSRRCWTTATSPATALSGHADLTREYCLQYRESSFNFVWSLLKQEGIYYFSTHSENKHMLVLADAASAHKTVPGYGSVLYAARPPPDLCLFFACDQG